MEPRAGRARPTAMRRTALVLAALTLALALAACGSDDTEVASDPGGSATPVPSPSQSPTASPTQSPTASPTQSPTRGTYPGFEPQDYAYTLSIQCFCNGTGVPVRVTVAGGEVTSAVFTADDTGRGGAREGEPADRLFWLTIDDVIAKANDTDAARVDVEWPAGQDYPSSVYVDAEELTVDEEIGYALSDVQR